MLAFAILAVLHGLIGPFLLTSFFVLWAGRASGSASSVPYSLLFSPSGAISTSLCIYLSPLPRLLVLGLEGGGGG